jgi:O-antigen/teichoic acid export membrane protein
VKLMTPSVETGASRMISASKSTRDEEEEIAPAGRPLKWLLRALSPETALHQSVISLADQAVVSFTNFLTALIIARACSKEELGLYMLGFSLILLITDLQTALITTPYMVNAPRLKGRAHALYTGSTLIHQLAFCVITMVAVTGGAVAVSSGVGPRELAPVLWALVLVVALIMLREHARRVSFARLRLKDAFIFDTFIAIGQIGGVLVLARFGLLSASRAYWVVGLVCGLAVLGWLWWDREAYEVRLSDYTADLRKNWLLGKWVFASGLIWALGTNLYPWFVAAFHGVASAGVWAACVGVVSVGNPILKGTQNLVGPKISHEHAEKGPRALRRWVLRITAILAVPLSLLCLTMFLWGGPLLTLLYGRQYAGNSLVVSILVLNLLVTVIDFSFSRALFSLARARVDFLVNAAGLFLMVTVGVWLVRSFGPLGAASGLLGASFVASVIRVIVFLKVSLASENVRF